MATKKLIEQILKTGKALNQAHANYEKHFQSYISGEISAPSLAQLAKVKHKCTRDLMLHIQKIK